MPNLAGFADFLTPLAAAMKEYRNRNSPQSRFKENLQAASDWLSVYGQEQKIEQESAQAQQASMRAQMLPSITQADISRKNALAQQAATASRENLSRSGLIDKQIQALQAEQDYKNSPVPAEILQSRAGKGDIVPSWVKTNSDLERYDQQQKNQTDLEKSRIGIQTEQSKIDWYAWLRGSKIVSSEAITGIIQGDPFLTDALKDVPNPNLGDITLALNQGKAKAAAEKDKAARELTEARTENVRTITAKYNAQLDAIAKGTIPTTSSTQQLAQQKVRNNELLKQRLIKIGYDPVTAGSLAISPPSLENLNTRITSLMGQMTGVSATDPMAADWAHELKMLRYQRQIFYPMPTVATAAKKVTPRETIQAQVSIWNKLNVNQRKQYIQRWTADGVKTVQFIDNNNNVVWTMDLQSNRQAQTPVKPLTRQSAQKSSVLTDEQKRKIAEMLEAE